MGETVHQPKCREMWMGTKFSLLQKSGKGRLGWQTPKPTSEGSTPHQKYKDPKHNVPQTLNYQKPQGTQKSTQEAQLDKYPSQTKSHKQWEAEMERLNSKYNLDCFSDLRVRFRVRWRRAVSIWTWVWDTHLNWKSRICYFVTMTQSLTLFSKCYLTIFFFHK